MSPRPNWLNDSASTWMHESRKWITSCHSKARDQLEPLLNSANVLPSRVTVHVCPVPLSLTWSNTRAQLEQAFLCSYAAHARTGVSFMVGPHLLEKTRAEVSSRQFFDRDESSDSVKFCIESGKWLSLICFLFICLELKGSPRQLVATLDLPVLHRPPPPVRKIEMTNIGISCSVGQTNDVSRIGYIIWCLAWLKAGSWRVDRSQWLVDDSCKALHIILYDSRIISGFLMHPTLPSAKLSTYGLQQIILISAEIR